MFPHSGKLVFDGNVDVQGPSDPDRLCKSPKCPAERMKSRPYCRVHQALEDARIARGVKKREDAERRARWRVAKTAEMERREKQEERRKEKKK